MNLKRRSRALPFILLCFSSSVFAARVRLADGTPVRVRLKADLTSNRSQVGDRVDFEVARPIIMQGMVAIPERAIAWGAVQTVKKGKEIQFDIESVRLPSLVEVRLRSVREKTKKSSKNVIKIENEFGNDVGMPHGSEFTAYVNEDVEVEVEGRPPQPAAPPAPSIVPVTSPAAARPGPPAAPSVGVPSAHVPAPAAARANLPAPPASQESVSTDERVTVECFSDPSGADILIDGDFVGNTPSILKLTLGQHRLEIQSASYKPYSQALNLTPGTGIRTLRVSLEKKE